MEFASRKIQEATDKGVEWCYDWGFRISIEKTQSVFLTRSRIPEGMKLQMYEREIYRGFK